MSLSKGKAKMKYQAGFFSCGSLQVYFTNLEAREPTILHNLWGKHNYQALFFFYRPDLGQNFVIFCLILLIILQLFYRIILQDKLHSFNIHDDRSTRFTTKL